MYIARVIGQPNVALSSLVLNENFSVGINDPASAETSIYPNPAGRSFFTDFNLTKSGKVTVIAFGVKGNMAEVLFEGNLDAGKQNLKINNELAAGYYILQIRTPDGTSNAKLIIN